MNRFKTAFKHLAACAKKSLKVNGLGQSRQAFMDAILEDPNYTLIGRGCSRVAIKFKDDNKQDVILKLNHSESLEAYEVAGRKGNEYERKEYEKVKVTYPTLYKFLNPLLRAKYFQGHLVLFYPLLDVLPTKKDKLDLHNQNEECGSKAFNTAYNSNLKKFAWRKHIMEHAFHDVHDGNVGVFNKFLYVLDLNIMWGSEGWKAKKEAEAIEYFKFYKNDADLIQSLKLIGHS